MQCDDNSQRVPVVTSREVVQSHGLILIDAYGVLVDSQGARPDAQAFIATLNNEKKPYFIVTNDAGKLPERALARYRGLGIPLNEGSILSSGMMIARYFQRHHLEGSRCCVLGPQDSVEYVRRAGGVIISPELDFDVLVLADDEGFPFWETVHQAMSSYCRRRDKGEAPRLVLANPDCIYPRTKESFGFAAGAIASMITEGLAVRYGKGVCVFDALGKPNTPLFEEALARFPHVSKEQVVMIGDQCATDILGANQSGIHSALLLGGVSAINPHATWPQALPRPHYILTTLE